jgi:dinuclear metal center YbgI/SA1388 family protein
MMKKPTIQTIYNWIDSVAPFESQEAFDNAGLQLGHPDQEVASILLALDVTGAVVEEAADQKVDLIISHHPLIFSPLTSLREDRYVPRMLCQLIKKDISLISAHTNLDKSAFSGSLAMLRRLGLSNIRQADDYALIGDFEEEVSGAEAQTRIARVLDNPVVKYGATKKKIKSLAAAGGAYSEGFHAAQLAGADAFLTGEVCHHHAVEAADAGIVLFEGGHFATEKLMMGALAQGLQSALDALKYTVQVYVSQQIPYLRD